MKLFRFTASTTNRVIENVTATLGPNAMIYSTRKIPGGIEILAGLPFGADQIVDKYDNEQVGNDEQHDIEIKVQESISNSKLLENLKLQIEGMNDSIRTLSDSVLLLQQVFLERIKQKRFGKISNYFRRINLTKINKWIYKCIYKIRYFGLESSTLR